MEAEVKHQIWVVFIWSTKFAEETDFGQLIISFSKKLGTNFDTVTQLRVKIKSVWHIVTYLNSFLTIIRLIDEVTLGVCWHRITYKLFWLMDEGEKNVRHEVFCN